MSRQMQPGPVARDPSLRLQIVQQHLPQGVRHGRQRHAAQPRAVRRARRARPDGRPPAPARPGAQRIPLRGQDQRAGACGVRPASHRAPAGAASARVAAGQALQGGFVQAQRRLFQQRREIRAVQHRRQRAQPLQPRRRAPLAVRRIRIEHAAAAHRARPARCARCSGRRAWRRPARRTPAAPSRTGPAPAFPPTAARHAPDGGPRRYAHAAASRRAPCRPRRRHRPHHPAAASVPHPHGARAGSNARPPQSPRAIAFLSMPARLSAQRCPAAPVSLGRFCAWMPRTRSRSPAGINRRSALSSPARARPACAVPVTTVPWPPA